MVLVLSKPILKLEFVANGGSMYIKFILPLYSSNKNFNADRFSQYINLFSEIFFWMNLSMKLFAFFAIISDAGFYFYK